MYDKCSLDRSLNQLYAEIYQLQNRVSNPLYANLPTTISASLADITFPIILSPRSADTDEAWAHWGEIDDHSSLSSLSDDEDWNDALVQLPPGGISSKTPDFKVEPWQTLLLLDDKAVEKSEEIAQGLYGLGVVVVGSRSPSGVVSAADSRRSSKDTSVEEDEGDLLKVLIEACDVSKTYVPTCRRHLTQQSSQHCAFVTIRPGGHCHPAGARTGPEQESDLDRSDQ